MLDTLHAWDTAILETVNGAWRSSLLDILLPIVSYTPLLWLLVGLACLLSFRHMQRNDKDASSILRTLASALLLITLCLGMNNLATEAVKQAAGRLRPYQALAGIHYLDDGVWKITPSPFTPTKKHGSSFFSGHASNTMALAVATAAVFPPAAPAVFALPAVVGYSRIYLGRHYPSDVVAGWLAGFLIASLTIRVVRTIRR